MAGSGFTDQTVVTFGATQASDVRVLNAGFLVAAAPAGAELTKVTVTTGAGTVTASTVAGSDPAGSKAITNIVPQGTNEGQGGPERMIDGDDSTYFFTGKVPQPGDYIGMDLGSVQLISSVSVKMGTTTYPNDFIAHAALEYSTDGVTWTGAGTFDTADVEATFPAGTQARYVRLRATATDAYWLRIPEFVVSATPPPVTGPTGQITGFAGKCVHVAYSRTADGTQVETYTCKSEPATSWTMATDGTIRAFGKCLTVQGSGTYDGVRVQLYTCNGSPAQQWRFTPGRDLISPNAGRCLDVTGVSSANGVPLQLWTCTGGANQKWAVPGP